MIDFLSKTKEGFRDLLGKRVDELSKDELEEVLISSDLGYEFVEDLLDKLPSKIVKGRLYNELFRYLAPQKDLPRSKPYVDIVMGVNGAGKTTSIAKLARFYKAKGENVLLVAGDTFRAAAIEQLSLWAKQLDVQIISSKIGADAAGLCFDAIKHAQKKSYDRVIIDTAGRLENKANLMKELEKIFRVCAKIPDIILRKIIVIDGTQGTMAINQANVFRQSFGLDGLMITKLDGTAKGGAVFAISKQLELPFLFVGVGEKQDDIVVFDNDTFTQDFVDGIFA